MSANRGKYTHRKDSAKEEKQSEKSDCEMKFLQEIEQSTWKSLICIVLLNNKNPNFMGRTRQHSYQSLQEESDAHNCLWAYQLSDSLSFCMWKRRECPCSTQPKIQGSLAIHRILQVAADSATQRRLLVTEPLQPLPIWWMSPWKLL